MKELKFTSADFVQGSQGHDDAVLDPNDPIFQMGVSAVPKRNFNDLQAWQKDNPANEKARIMRETGIKPGTPAWFALWFGK
jgi:hypothetical protein